MVASLEPSLWHSAASAFHLRLLLGGEVQVGVAGAGHLAVIARRHPGAMTLVTSESGRGCKRSDRDNS
jgi:hypothetical protein